MFTEVGPFECKIDLMKADAALLRWRKILAFASCLFTACLGTVVYTAGDGELVRIAYASFAKPVCWMEIEVVRNPLAPKRDLCIYRGIDPNEFPCCIDRAKDPTRR